MKIINKTGFPLSYVVTYSGYTLADAFKTPNAVEASGYVNKNSSTDVPLTDQTNPFVYIGKQVTTGNSKVSVSIEEE
jgi:hypothetical protein